MKELTSAQRFIIDKLYDGYTISTTTQDNLLNNIIVISAYIDNHIRISTCMTANEVNNLIESNLIIMESENDKSYIYFKLSPHPKYIKTQLIKLHTIAHHNINNNLNPINTPTNDIIRTRIHPINQFPGWKQHANKNNPNNKRN